jgi:uncharacterized membrane protein/glutaredoxin
MSRRRQTPRFHRWSRYAIAAVAALGALNTGYLTLTKLFGGETACPTSGCEQVLSSPYATVFGQPLALFGFLAYVAMLVFALAPLAVKPENNKQLRLNLEEWTWLLLFAGATAMMVFSGYLMFIMATEFVAKYGFGSICIYCIVSALFATTLFVLTLLGRTWEDTGKLFFIGSLVSLAVLIGSVGVYATANRPPDVGGNVGPAVTTQSGQAEVTLARHLTDIGAKMYSAYWCPHCHDQKQLFGQEAAKQLPIVECAADGRNAQVQLCQAAGIQGFPTWEINGQKYSGTRNLNELADLSGYQGPRNFQN